MWAATRGVTKEDPILINRLFHIHSVQEGFLATWTRKPFDRSWAAAGAREAGFSDLASMARRTKEYHGKLKEYLGSLEEAELGKPMILPWAGSVENKVGVKFAASTLRETLFQVAMHSAHHRGQVNARLRELGIEPPNVDFIFWVWLAKPGADWNLPDES